MDCGTNEKPDVSWGCCVSARACLLVVVMDMDGAGGTEQVGKFCWDHYRQPSESSEWERIVYVT